MFFILLLYLSLSVFFKCTIFIFASVQRLPCNNMPFKLTDDTFNYLKCHKFRLSLFLSLTLHFLITFTCFLKNESYNFFSFFYQVHRRARALLRFSNALKNQRENKDKINFSYLLNYMIPIVQSFLFNDAYKKHVHVIDAAIETLGSIASVLSWHHYELLLKQYLELISKDAEHHKTIVK